MDQLFIKMLDFIDSKTMKDYLLHLYIEKKIRLSAEDMLSIAYNSNSTFRKKFTFISLLEDYITDNKAFRRICDVAQLLMSDFAKHGFRLCAEEAIFSDEDELDRINSKALVFLTVKEATDYAARCSHGYLRCKLCKGNSVLLDTVDITGNGIIDFRTTCHNDSMALYSEDISTADLSIDRYVYIPNPFEPGDIVTLYNDPENKYIIISAEPAEPERFGEALDYIDISAMVVPYEFREHATPTKIKEHFARLSEARNEGVSGSLDVISCQHTHLPILSLELVSKAAETSNV